MMPLRNLLREPLRKFKPYIVGKSIDDVRREYGLTGRIAKLASNENPLGSSPLAVAAMRRAVEDVSLYPDDSARDYRAKVAERYAVPPESVFAASGSVEVLELLAVAFLEPGDVVVSSEKTFAMYALAAEKAGAEFRAAPMTDGGYRYDLEAMARLLDPSVKLVFLANPTNPTGTWFTAVEFDRFMARVPSDTLVVYDSAYEEYAGVLDLPDPMVHFRAGRRLLLLRTLSKAYGLAGIRIGYAVGPEEIIQGLMMVRTPFNTSVVAQAGALAALDDTDFLRRSREHSDRELAFLREGLTGLPVTIPPSQTNFIFIDTGKKAGWLFEELQRVGVIVRPVGGRAIRVSSGLREDNERFVEHFRRLVLQPGGEA
jgi:histidinol-phosphate aminotransferase